MRKLILLVGLLMAASDPSHAEETHRPYAGLQAREIATLSQSDIDDLEAGRGWGFALAAELNGHPGPAHVLDLADALGLTADQVARVERIFEDMRDDAMERGVAFIAAERALDTAFSQGGLGAAELAALVEAAGQARSALRYVHLSRHLETVEILTADQIAAYNILRGYTADPCQNVPEGHNADMRRRHNGCEG